MMAVVPPNNLPPDAQPWARNRDEAIAQLQFDVLKNAQTTDNSLSAVNQALTSIGKQITSIAAATAAASSAASAAGAAAATANAAVADLAARVSVTASIASFNTGTLPNDSTDHFYGAAIPITIAVPTGKLIVTVGCGQATVSSGSGAAIAEATFLIPGYSAYYAASGRMYNASPNNNMGGSIAVSRAFTVAPGTYTITGQMSAWSAGASASINFYQPYMTVQVTG